MNKSKHFLIFISVSILLCLTSAHLFTEELQENILKNKRPNSLQDLRQQLSQRYRLKNKTLAAEDIKGLTAENIKGLTAEEIKALAAEDMYLSAALSPFYAKKTDTQTLFFQLRFKVKSGYHINSDKPLDRTLIPSSAEFHALGFTLKRLQFPLPKLKEIQPNILVSLYDDADVYVINALLEKNKTTGKENEELLVAWSFLYQPCTDYVCYPPVSLTGKAKLSPASLSSEIPSFRGAAFAGSSLLQTLEESNLITSLFLLGLLFAILGGLLLNVMPCVLPVVYLKLYSLQQLSKKIKSSPSSQDALQKNHSEIRLALFHYSMGIFIAFSFLILIIAALQAGGAQLSWGFQFQNPTYLLTLFLLCWFFALNLLGLFSINIRGFSLRSLLPQNTDTEVMALEESASRASSYKKNVSKNLPKMLLAKLAYTSLRLRIFIAGLLTKLSLRLAKNNMLKNIFLGMLSTLLSTPCTAPFLSPALGFFFSKSLAEVALVMLAIAFGFALPYLIAAFFPLLSLKVLSWLPKPGLWNERIKKLSAIPLLLLCLWLLSLLYTVHSLQAMVIVALYALFLGLLFSAFAFFQKKALNQKSENPLPSLPFRLGQSFFSGKAFLLILLSSVIILMISFSLAEKQEYSLAGNNSAGNSSANDIDIPSQYKDTDWIPVDKASTLLTLLNMEKKTVFLSISADWCITCKVNERLVLNTKRADKLFRTCQVIKLKADWTKPSHFIESYQVGS